MIRALSPNVLIATPEEASRGAPEATDDNRSGATLDNIDVEGVWALQSVVLENGDGPDKHPGYKIVFAWTDSHGPWLAEFPTELVTALSKIQADQFREIGIQWWERLWEDDEESVRVEMIADTPVESLEHAVKLLGALATSSICQEKKLYWVVPDC